MRCICVLLDALAMLVQIPLPAFRAAGRDVCGFYVDANAVIRFLAVDCPQVAQREHVMHIGGHADIEAKRRIKRHVLIR